VYKKGEVMKAMKVSVTLQGKDKLSPVLSRIEGKLDTFEAKTSKIAKTTAKMGAVGVAGLGAMGTAIGSMVSKYQDLAKAQGEVQSLGVNAKGIKAITAEARAFSSTFSGTSQADFVRASYDIKSGISSLSDVGVAKFTALAAMTGKATKSTTEQMTSFFATGYGIFNKQFDALQAKTMQNWKGLSQEAKDIKFGEYFSAGIAGAVKEFKTNGGQMQSAIEALGATATTSNVPLAEQLAILGTLQKSMSGSEAATKYKAFITAAVSASEKLKLSFLDSNNQLLSTPKILDILKKKYGKTLDDMEKSELKKAFGTDEAMAYITALYDETDNLTASQKRLSKTMQSGTKDVKKMALAMNKGHEFELLKQKTDMLFTAIGAKFAPMALSLANTIGDITSKTMAWMDANEGTVDTIVAVTTSLGAGLAVFTAGSLAVSALAFAFKPLSGVVRLAIAAFSLLTGKSKSTSKAIRTVSTGLNALAGKSFMAKMGVQMPKKTSLVGKFKGMLSVLSRFALANPIVLGAVMTTVAAYGAYNLYKETQEKDGNLGRDNKLIAQYKKEENKPKALQTVSASQAVEAQGRKDAWKDTSSKPLSNTFSLASQLSSLSKPNPVSKTTNNDVTVNAPINITVNSVDGQVPTQEIANTTEAAVYAGINNSKTNTKFEDEE